MKITYKTKIKDLIDKNTVNTMVEDAMKKYLVNSDTRMTILEVEMTTGGLSKEAMFFNDNSPLYDKAREVYNEYGEITTSLTNLKAEIANNTQMQRQKELTQLKVAIEERMEEIDNIRNQLKNSASKNGNYGTRYISQEQSERASALYASRMQEEIGELHTKLENVKIELGK